MRFRRSRPGTGPLMKREAPRMGVFTRRALLVAGGQVAALSALGVRLYQVQVEEGQRYSTLAANNSISQRLIAPPRGRILDRFGQVLAGNKLNWRALLVAEEVDSVSNTLDNFSRLVGLEDHERARVEREVKRHRRFIPVMIRDFLSWDEMAKIEVNAPDLPGVVIDVGTTRIYPFSEKLAHIVGYVAPPNEADVAEDSMLALPGIRIGRAGMERERDVDLRGTAGAVQMEVNAVGRVIRELDRQEGTPGADVALTLDVELQQQVLTRLGDESASAVVMDCRNGEVLAMTTTPSFDPSLFDKGVSQAQWIAWTSDKKAPLINKASAGEYAPGSTFKVCVALAGLESKLLSPTDRIYCPGYIDVGTARFHCWSKNGHGSLDLYHGLKFSCDVFFYEVAKRIGIDRIAAMAHRLGMGVDTGIDLPGARPGFIPTREWRVAHGHVWNLGDTIVSGIGQGYILVTPLSLCTYAARVATGRQIVPHLTRTVDKVLQPGAELDGAPLLGLPDKFLADVRHGMWAVVNEGGGTAPVARLPPSVSDGGRVQLAGKTGSSQVHRVSREQRESGHFDSRKLPWELRPHALFVAYAPYDAPRYAVSVVVEHGNAGAAAAAPLARDIMTDVLLRDPVNRQESPQVAELGTAPSATPVVPVDATSGVRTPSLPPTLPRR
ncbi:MAG TPA: penicillin-binding protein 2 [Acidisphaera sp.]|nr:penicillin-binding protein 2 [Acidisphaera sp.]